MLALCNDCTKLPCSGRAPEALIIHGREFNREKSRACVIFTQSHPPAGLFSIFNNFDFCIHGPGSVANHLGRIVPKQNKMKSRPQVENRCPFALFATRPLIVRIILVSLCERSAWKMYQLHEKQLQFSLVLASANQRTSGLGTRKLWVGENGRKLQHGLWKGQAIVIGPRGP
jgi:hypothetical protein